MRLTLLPDMGDNYFEFSVPPFFVLHPIFNLELLQPYFPPLLDTSEVVEKLSPIELNIEFIAKALVHWIMYTGMKGTRQKNMYLYQVVKLGQLLLQGK
jgi:hypothetical protein